MAAVPPRRHRAAPVVPDLLTPAVDQLARALEQAVIRPEFNMQPQIKVINPQVAAPAVHVAPPVTEVYVDAPEVHVAAPEVTVNPQVTVQWAPRQSKMHVVRDANGLIVDTITTYEY